MKTAKQLLSLVLAIALLFSLAVPTMAADGDIVVYYTNDVHTYMNNEEGWRYSTLASLKKSDPNAILVDAGDHIQGTAFGGMDKGVNIIKLMNAVGVDVATLGNHEFDYGMERCLQVTKDSNYPYVSCNFHTLKNGAVDKNVLDSFKIIEKSGKKIAFVGITTPQTFTSSTPAYFQDGNGNYIYGIHGGSDGKALYESVQKAVDEAKAAGADIIIALGHLGVDPSSAPWTSEDVIANTTGLNAFIDGHSHTTMPCQMVKDKSGKEIPLSQTGSYFNTVGKMTIAADGKISTELLDAEAAKAYTPDAAVKAIEDAWVNEVNEKLGVQIGYSEVTFDNYDKDGTRLVRRQETNTGDFAADALYYLFDNMDMDVDVAIMNGGGVRNKTITGPITYLTCKEIHTFGNVACLQTVTGQQLLDALEWGASKAVADGSGENGGFLHISGAKYTIDLSIPSTVQADDKGVWIGGPTGKYRVTDLQIKNKATGAYEPVKLDAKYNLAGYNYTLRDLGDGFAMFDGAVNVLDYVSEDYMVLANYVQSFAAKNGVPTITNSSAYATLNGDGRITILNSTYAPTAAQAATQPNTGAAA